MSTCFVKILQTWKSKIDKAMFRNAWAELAVKNFILKLPNLSLNHLFKSHVGVLPALFSLLTLSFYNNEQSNNRHFLILLSSLARNSREHKLKRIFEIPWVLFEKSLSLYFDWPKSWIWRTLEKVMNIFCKWHFHNASKKVFWPKIFLKFMHGFKSAIYKKYP